MPAMVPGTGLEPASREAADFKSAMFTNFITPAGRSRFYHCAAGGPIARHAAAGAMPVKRGGGLLCSGAVFGCFGDRSAVSSRASLKRRARERAAPAFGHKKKSPGSDENWAKPLTNVGGGGLWTPTKQGSGRATSRASRASFPDLAIPRAMKPRANQSPPE
jgi:hypothetical protein